MIHFSLRPSLRQFPLVRTLQPKGRIGNLLEALIAHLGKPELDGLRFGAGNGLNQPEQRLRVGYIGESLFSVFRGQFQLVTVCHQLAALSTQALFELVPVFPGDGRIRLLREDADDIDNREPPCLCCYVIDAAYRVILEESGMGGNGLGH